MRWQLHRLKQVLLEPVPLALRRRLQDLRGSTRLDLETDYPRKAAFLRRILNQGLEVEGRSVLEIGTGWHPVLPLLLSLAGAEQVVGTDLNPWMTRRSLEETLRALRPLAGRVAEDLALPREECGERLDAWLRACTDPALSTTTVLARARLEYRAPLDARRTPFSDREFDYLVSYNVLEHVPPGAIREIARESERILRPGGHHLHHIGPGDHFSHVDEAVSSVNFLRFSPRAWRLIGGAGKSYQNRLRCVDYGRIFADEGFEVIYEEIALDGEALRQIREGVLRPHEAFAAYTPEELAGNMVDIFCRQRPPTPNPPPSR
jgi:SAM-dependent methyltransferase